ncbi:MAG: hypothetical protein HY822_07550 [Acidobacteria bacterium]|nr:hypothetical protein [Acidobacteriota bacterium]
MHGARLNRRQFLCAAAGAAGRSVGITVMPEYIQVEGIGRVLDNLLRRARATSVTTSPYVMEPAGEKTGSREPPIDAGAGKVRLLDRPLWGRRELFVRTAPSFEPDARLYRGLRYQPAAVTELTRKQGPLIGEFVSAARARGLKVYLQVQAAIPPGYRVQFGGPAEEDCPRLPDGRIPPRRLANNGSLASMHIRAYTEALIRDLLTAYPEVDGLRFDWPEYPPYLLDDVFLDFGEPARQAAERLGLPFDRLRREAGLLYRQVHGALNDRDPGGWLAELEQRPLLHEWLRFKATLVEQMLAGYRKALTQAGGASKELLAHAFPPPLSRLSGMDFDRASRHVDGIGVKFYTMHWPMILRFWGDELLQANPGLSESRVAAALARWLDMSDGPLLPHLADYVYPEPGAPHPAGSKAQARKIAEARKAAGKTPVFALAHGYGPAADFRRRVEAVFAPSGRRLWVNRYGYLSDEKLEILAAVE